jgi:hypothetical protein
LPTDDGSGGATKKDYEMYDLWMSLGVLSLLVQLYCLVGLLVPRLPLVRTRGRAAKFVGLSLAVMLGFGYAAEASLTPERRQAMEQERAARERQVAEDKATRERAAQDNATEVAAQAARVAAGSPEMLAVRCEGRLEALKPYKSKKYMPRCSCNGVIYDKGGNLLQCGQELPLETIHSMIEALSPQTECTRAC